MKTVQEVRLVGGICGSLLLGIALFFIFKWDSQSLIMRLIILLPLAYMCLLIGCIIGE